MDKSLCAGLRDYQINPRFPNHVPFLHPICTTLERARSLEESGYIKRSSARETKGGFEAPTYELAVKSYLAILLNSISLEELLSRLDETSGNDILANIISTIEL
jgi:hypothetical protein